MCVCVILTLYHLYIYIYVPITSWYLLLKSSKLPLFLWDFSKKSGTSGSAPRSNKRCTSVRSSSFNGPNGRGVPHPPLKPLRKGTASVWPLRAAICKGDLPSRSNLSTKAPLRKQWFFAQIKKEKEVMMKKTYHSNTTPSLLPCSREYSMASIAPADASINRLQVSGTRPFRWLKWAWGLNSPMKHCLACTILESKHRLQAGVWGASLMGRVEEGATTFASYSSRKSDSLRRAIVSQAQKWILQLSCEVTRFWYLKYYIYRFMNFYEYK